MIEQYGEEIVNNSTYTKTSLAISMTSYKVYVTYRDTNNVSGGKGYLGYVNKLNSTYFYLNASDMDYAHYPVGVQWQVIGY